MIKKKYSTDREIGGLEPKDRWYDVKDTKARNLIVRVGPKTAKGDFRRTFYMYARFPGSKSPTRHAFGEYKAPNSKSGDLTLVEAREKVDEWRKLIRQDTDPREAEKRREKDASRIRDLTFENVMEEYLARHVKGQRRARIVENEIRKEVIPHWRDIPVSKITRSDVVSLV